jgi:antitoxin (DNA-binding transcriptional repressor) of toxin-antitoxin stability system
MSTVSASVARQTLPAQLDRVEAGEEISITRHGRVIAVLVQPDVLRNRRASTAWNAADQLGARLESARRAPLDTAALTPERAEELVRGIEADRSARGVEADRSDS